MDVLNLSRLSCTSFMNTNMVSSNNMAGRRRRRNSQFLSRGIKARLHIRHFTSNYGIQIAMTRRNNDHITMAKLKRRKTITSQLNQTYGFQQTVTTEVPAVLADDYDDDICKDNGNKDKISTGNAGDGTMFKDLGGMNQVIKNLKTDVIASFYDPGFWKWMGVKPLAGILLHGPPGCGKTKLAHAIANECNVPFYDISATELVSGVSGESEKNIRNLFLKAYRTPPSIIFIDEIDAIASKRENAQRETDRRIVTQLMTCMHERDKLGKLVNDIEDSESSQGNAGHVLVIAATNRPDVIDPALRRPGRFDREISIGIPDENARFQILSVVTHNLRVDGALDLAKIAKSTSGFVGSDLNALAKEAVLIAVRRVLLEREVKLKTELQNNEDSEAWCKKQASREEKENAFTTMADFEEALKYVQPSTRREGFSTIPDVTWDDVGGLQSLKSEFDFNIVRHIKNPEDYEMFGVNPETGFLLHGPPGCGKTLIVKAVANEAGANFIYIKGPQLLSKYVGESELEVRKLFSRARTCSPCIIFFDEIDGLAAQRGTEGGQAVDRVVTQLLIELDGADQRQGVYAIGATNRLDVIDPALLRPGRFGRVVHVPLPTPDDRGMILTALGRKYPVDTSVDLMSIGRDSACENFSGADLTQLMKKAAETAMKERQASDGSLETIKDSHFGIALEEVTPSVNTGKVTR